jgi:hypothetical protein
MYIPFEEMPAHARVWIYQADRKFDSEEKAWIEENLKSFCEQWNTHGSKMPTSFDLKYDQFIIFAVDGSQLGASGCSIDSSVKKLREIEAKLNVNLLDKGKIPFMDESEVFTTSLPGVKSQIQEGRLGEDTLIFNPMVAKKQDFDEKWLIPAKESWLKKFFDN